MEIKRLQALAGVHDKVLDALRAGKMTLKQVKLCARLADKPRQAELADNALVGCLHDFHLHQAVTGEQITALAIAGVSIFDFRRRPIVRMTSATWTGARSVLVSESAAACSALVSKSSHFTG